VRLQSFQQGVQHPEWFTLSRRRLDARSSFIVTDDELYEELNGELDVIYAEIIGLRLDQHIFWRVQAWIRDD
jgi:hypothetical protein